MLPFTQVSDIGPHGVLVLKIICSRVSVLFCEMYIDKTMENQCLYKPMLNKSSYYSSISDSCQNTFEVFN
jgi:hypothetical protein